VYIPFYIPWSVSRSASRLRLRIVALCVSGSLRALCGIAAGGSKSALTLHFATPESGTGDLGELSAKDASKETVLSLFGMLLGSLLVPHLTTPLSTYTVMFLLLAGHLTTNYKGVRGVVLRTLNRQRAGIAWTSYRMDAFASPDYHQIGVAAKAQNYGILHYWVGTFDGSARSRTPPESSSNLSEGEIHTVS